MMILTVFFPALAAYLFLIPALRRRWKLVSVLASGLSLLFSALVPVLGEKEAVLFTLLDLPFAFRADTVGCFFAILFAALFFAVAVYATEYLAHDNNPCEFAVVYLLTLSAMLGLSYASTLPCYYMFFECLTLASFPLILHDLRSASRKAALKYLSYSLLGAALVLFGMSYSYSFFGTLSFRVGGYASVCSPMMLAVAFLTVMGFGCKAGIMPLHDWLPTAHPQAPAPASAILSGCVTKAGALGILRVVYYLYGTTSLRGTWVQTALIAIALVTVFSGSMLAYKERILKKRLAYSTVSQVSYALFGIFLMSTQGFIGAMLQVLLHAVTKVCLFLCSGSILHQTKRETVFSLDGRFQYFGIGKTMPLTMLGYSLASLSLVGLPPFGGFVSKWFLAEGSFAALGLGGWIGAAVLLVSALLTAGYLLSITSRAFFPTQGDELCEASETGYAMSLPILVLAVCTLVFGISTLGLANVFAGIASAAL